MKVYGQLERAQVENVTALPAAGVKGRKVYLTTTSKEYLDNGTSWVEVFNQDNDIPRSNIAAGTADRLVINATGSGDLSDAAAITAARALISDANGIPTHSATTSAELAHVSGVTSAIQTQFGNKQDLDSDLTALAGLSSTGIIARTGSGTASTRTVTGTTNQIGVANGDGVSANPTLSIATDPVLPGTGSVTVPIGTTAQRPGSPVEGMFRYNDDTNAFEGYANAAWGSIGGGGGGGINYITNGTAEVDTSGWAAYQDAAASSPVDGTGGAPTVTFTRSTSSPLRGTASFLITKDAANRQGEGAGYAFTIDSADQAKVLRIKSNYSVSSGTFSYGDGTVATPSDVRVFIYDVTNAVLIEPTQTLLDGSGDIVTEFQAASNSLSYRLILHVATTSASAWVLKLDNITVGPSDVARGPLITDPVSYTPTISGFGTVTGVSFTWARLGKYLYLNGTFTAGTTAASAARITIPFTIDSGISSSGLAVGEWTTNKSATNATRNSATAFVKLSNGTNFISASNVGDGSTAENLDEINGSQIISTGTVVSVFAMIPIQGWGSNVVTSSDSGTRVVAMSTKSKASNVPSVGDFSAGTNIVWTTANFDTQNTHSMFDGTTVTIPESGWYDVAAKNHLTGTEALNDTQGLYIYKNGAALDFEGSRNIVAGVGYTKVTIAGLYYFNANDLITLRILSTTTGAAFLSASDLGIHSFSVSKRQSPQSIGMADVVAAKYSTNAGQSIPNITQTTINFEDQIFDTHNAVTVGAAWKFTAPTAGLYLVRSMVMLSAATGWELGETKQLFLIKNGAITEAYLDYHEHYSSDSSASATYTHVLNGSAITRLAAGDTLSIDILQNNDAAVPLLATTPANYICITRIG